MIRLLWLSLSKSWQEQFPTRGIYFAELVASLLDVLLYYFVSQSFGKLFTDAPQEKNYFEYVVWNEALIALPIAALLAVAKSVRSASSDGIWEILLTAPRKPIATLLLLSQADLVRNGARAILILGFAFALGANFSFSQVGAGLILLLVSVPLFLSMGVLAAAGLLRFQRGYGALTHLAQVATVLAGTYFPIAVFPDWIAQLSIQISPWSWLIHGSQENNLKYAVWFIIAGVIAAPVANKALTIAIDHQRRSGLHLLF